MNSVEKHGPKAYPRTLLLITVMYCFSKNINNYEAISRECRESNYLKIILMGKKPTRGTFTNFLNKSDPELIHRVFASTLVLLNDMDVLSIARVFIDGTDIIVRGSRFYFIKQRNLRVMDQLNKWGLIHDGSSEGINKTLKEYENNTEMVKLIKLARRRIRRYKHSVYKKRDLYESIFETRGNVKLSVIFQKHVF